MPKHRITADQYGTHDADTFFIQDGLTTIAGFDPSEDRVLFVGRSYSDIISLEKPVDGWEFDTFAGVHFEVHAVDYNGDGITDTQITGSDSTVILYGVDPDALWGWNLAGG